MRPATSSWSRSTTPPASTGTCRLEVDGVLKSWAVTKGPSLDPADKRLAVRTEDHPLSYATFEGTIPKGQYGGGTVMLWDRGTWAPIAGKSAADLEDGHLHFTLDGERMKGEWLLVRMKGRPGEKRENWLLRKIDDRFADPGHDLVARALTSVATGRSMAEIAAGVEREATPAPRAEASKAKTRRPKWHAGKLPCLSSAPARHARGRGADRQWLDARDQVRRLSSRDRGGGRPGDRLHPLRPRLDGDVPADCRCGRRARPAAQPDRRGDRGDGRRTAIPASPRCGTR